ncbi:MAG: hypothetical protein WC796_03355 [Candidatus Pacearchaeota archaeon]|jgi:hypothetical protein
MNKKGGLILLGIALIVGIVIGVMFSVTLYKFTSLFRDNNPLPQGQNNPPTCIEKDNTFTTVSTNYTQCDKCCSNNCTHYESSCPAGLECLQAHKCL